MARFFDIFSRRKMKDNETEKLKVVADNREKNSLVIPELCGLGVEVEMEQLEVADFLVGDIAIERKTAGDLVSSMINKRLMRQLEGMNQYEKNMLIIEGDMKEVYENKNLANPVRGMMLSIILNYNVPIIFTKDSEDTARFLYLLAKREAKSEAGMRAKKRKMTEKEKCQFILEGFAGVGPANARKLLEKHKTLRKIFNLSYSELEKDIGKKAEAFEILDFYF